SARPPRCPQTARPASRRQLLDAEAGGLGGEQLFPSILIGEGGNEHKASQRAGKGGRPGWRPACRVLGVPAAQQEMVAAADSSASVRPGAPAFRQRRRTVHLHALLAPRFRGRHPWLYSQRQEQAVSFLNPVWVAGIKPRVGSAEPVEEPDQDASRKRVISRSTG